MNERKERAPGHGVDCTCGYCDNTPRSCPHCTRTGLVGKRGLGAHLRTAHRLRSRKREYHLVPDGQGYLKRAQIEKTANLENISRFASILARAYPGRKWKKQNIKITQVKVEEWENNPNQWHPLPWVSIPNNMMATVGRLSISANVPFRAVIVTLLLYGIEHLSREIRATKVAPDPSGASLRKLQREARNPAQPFPSAEEL